jgi:hypothetical protein
LRSAHGDVFRFTAKHKRDPAGGVELQDLVRRGVNGPDVVLRIDAQTDGGIEAVDILSELADELSGLVELEQSRPAVHERPVVAKRRVGMAGARVDVDLTLRIRAHAGHFADVEVSRRLQEIRNRLERNLRRSALRVKRRASEEQGSNEN